MWSGERDNASVKMVLCLLIDKACQKLAHCVSDLTWYRTEPCTTAKHSRCECESDDIILIPAHGHNLSYKAILVILERSMRVLPSWDVSNRDRKVYGSFASLSLDDGLI
jgi:hypothetical protein